MHSEHTTLDLVGNIYDAVNDETLWPIFLERLAGTLRSAATNLFVQDLRHPGGAASATFGTDPSFNRSYADHYGKVNIFLIRGRPLLRTGSVCFSDELCPDKEAIRAGTLSGCTCHWRKFISSRITKLLDSTPTGIVSAVSLIRWSKTTPLLQRSGK
jgi:hypothetical protein